MSSTAETAISGRSESHAHVLVRAIGLILFAQLIYWAALSIGEDLSRPADLTAPASVTLYLTDNWEIDSDDRPIAVPLDDYPLYDYKDVSEDPAANRGVFVTGFSADSDAQNLAIFFSSNYGLHELRLNGRLIKGQSPTDPQGSLSGFGPQAFTLPDEFVLPGQNELLVLVSGRTYKSLPLYFVGPAEDVMMAARWGQLFAVDLVVAATALMGFVVLFCVLVNWPSSDRSRINALVVLLLTWILRNLSILGLFDFLPLPALRIATYSANYLLLVAFAFFAIAWSGYGKRFLKYRWTALALCVVVPVVLVIFNWRTLPIAGGVSLPWMLDNALTLVSMPFVILLFAQHIATTKNGQGLETLLFVVCATALLVDKLDNMFSLSVPFVNDLYLTFYSAPMCGLLLSLGMTASIAAQATRARLAVTNINQQLEEKLAESEAQIRRQAGRHARAEERQRIMRDMHDGLGSKLSALVAEASDPDLPRSLLVDGLVDSIQELRLIVDSLDTEGDSLATALGSYRARIEPALQAAGIDLIWTIDDVDGGAMSAEQVLEVFRILQEALSNVIQHSRATSVEVSLTRTDDKLFLTVTDDGQGLSSDTLEGNGLHNMRVRARRLMGELRVASESRGVHVELAMPVSEKTQH